MSDTILYTDAARYETDVLSHTGPVVVDFYSTECPPCEALAAKYESLAEIYGQDVRFVKIFRQENREFAAALGVTASPTVLFVHNGQELGSRLLGGIKRADLEAGLQALLPPARAHELSALQPKRQTEVDVLIIGGGPAGLTAGIYSAQAKLNTMVVDKALAGGNLNLTHSVSNFPGFPEPQPGWMLAHQMREQAKVAGVIFREAVDITALNLDAKQVVLDGLETIHAKKIVLATGTSPRVLGLPGELEFQGKGIHYCATCDGKYYEGKHIVVIGGGNSAIEESLFLSRFASRITIVHQFGTLQANQVAQQKAFADPKISFRFDTEPRAFLAVGDTIGKVEVEHLPSGEMQQIDCDGVFIFAGMAPNLQILEGSGLALDDWGYLKVDAEMHTSHLDIFAAGDMRSKRYRQMTTAVSDGTIAAIQIAGELQ